MPLPIRARTCRRYGTERARVHAPRVGREGGGEGGAGVRAEGQNLPGERQGAAPGHPHRGAGEGDESVSISTLVIIND